MKIIMALLISISMYAQDIQKETATRNLYQKLLDYKGMQTKEKMALINKEPLFAKEIKISPNGLKIIIDNKLYNTINMKIVYEPKINEIKVFDFYDNDNIYIATKKEHGLFSIKDKKFIYKNSNKKKFESIKYSNAVLRYKNVYVRKNSYIHDTVYYKVNLDKLEVLKEFSNNHTTSNNFFVNSNKSYALSYNTYSSGKISSINLLDLKTFNTKRLDYKITGCHSPHVRFVSTDSIHCGDKLFNLKTNVKKYVFDDFITDKKRKIYNHSGELCINDMNSTGPYAQCTKVNNFIALRDLIINNNKNIMIIKTKDNLYNVYNVINFLSDKKTKIVNKIWLEIDELIENGFKLSQLKLLEKALGITYSKDIKIDSSNFKYQDNKVEVTLEPFGTFVFKAEDIIKSLSDSYILKNVKFEIKNNDIKLIAADLFPSDSGYILSYGRISPVYKQSLQDLKLKYKLSSKDEKRIKKANKMYWAAMFDEAEAVYDVLIDKNAIGFDGDNRINKVSYKALKTVSSDYFFDLLGLQHRLYTQTKAKVIEELKTYRKINLGIEVIDVQDISKEGALIHKILQNNSVLKVGDVIVSIDGNTVRRANDVNEVANSIESSSMIGLEILRNDRTMNIDIEVKSNFKYSNKLSKYYRLYILHAVDSRQPRIAQEAFTQYQEDINNGSLIINKIEKEKNLLLEALVLILNKKEKEAFKKLFTYEDEFDKESLNVLLQRRNAGWAPLIKYRKKLSVLFEISANKFKSRSPSLRQYEIYDLNGNLIKADNVKKKSKKKLQPSSRKGGVLE